MSTFNFYKRSLLEAFKPLKYPFIEYKIRVRERAPHQKQFSAGVNSSSDRAQQIESKINNKKYI